MSNIIRSFNNSDIRFEQRGERTWVCITDMAKASDKKVNDYMRLSSSQELISTLQFNTGIPVLESNVGGAHTGTWAIEEIALDFAGWCTIPFKIWMLQQIKTLMTTGTVSLPSNPNPSNVEIACNILENVYRGVLKPELIAGLKASYVSRKVPELKPELEQTQSLLAHSNIDNLLLGATQLGKRLGVSAIKVNKLLLASGLQIKNEAKSSKTDPDYLPTELGKDFSEFTTSTSVSGGSHHQQLKWRESVISLLKEELRN